MLLKAMGKTTTQTCAVATWGNNQGVRVCMMFKVLVTFSFVALLAFVGMVIVAVVARKKQSGHTYEPALNPANMRANTSYNPLRSNVHSAFYSAPEPAYGVDERNKVGGKPEKQEGEAGEATSYYG